ncbi:tetratricopeptide repeat protein [Endozoicomonas arenosclerae]|uniref:tetratricopeptide repeat protein n=1 Tax=Endozoicomonas arenosclerae TaxID=1633495 RepID=UPI000783D973|nr:tetratricopeptide repeat protein [Endozoicomonas arenosclerae]
MKKHFFKCTKQLGLVCLSLLMSFPSFSEAVTERPTLEQLIEARKQWEILSERGDADASAKLGALYLSGSLGTLDFIKARKYLALGAKVDVSARLAYGHLLMKGLGGETDLAGAEQVFATASKLGSLEGLYLRAKLVLGRSASELEVRNAVNDIHRAATKGFPPALSTIAELHRTGTFLEKNPQKAVEYYLKAAERGYSEALSNVAEMHLFAELGSADINKAEDFYRKAISKGVKSANYSLAFFLYNKNQNNKASLGESFRIAKIASLAWDERCQYLLGLMYFEGMAVASDHEQAYFWLDLAASAGVFEAHHIRALVARTLSKEQINKVKSRAREWFVANHDRPHGHLFIDSSKHRYQ